VSVSELESLWCLSAGLVNAPGNLGALVAAMEFKSQRGPSFGNNFNNRTEEALGLAADSQMAVERGLFGRLKPWFGFVMLVERAKGSLGAVRVPSNMPFPADTIFNGASYIDRYRFFFERMVAEGNYDAVALLTAEAESAEYVEPSASLSLANLEAAIRARIAYIKALPDDVFNELTTT
jgi:type-2 restriction enzyme paeR7I